MRIFKHLSAVTHRPARLSVLVAACLSVGVAGAPAALAQDDAAVPDGTDIVIDLGIGGVIANEYPGSDQYSVRPQPLVALRQLSLPIFGEVVDGTPKAISVFPSFNIEGERDAGATLDTGDFPVALQPFQNELSRAARLSAPQVDTSVELGLGVAARYGMVRAVGEVRYGVTGHNGFVGEFGIDGVFAMFDNKLTVSAGPRLSVADDAYMDAYFSTRTVRRADVGLAGTGVVAQGFDAGPGVKDVGAAIAASYAVTEKFRVVGKAEWKHYVGDAGNSPIVRDGDRNSFVLGLGVTYRFGLDLY